MKCAAINEVVCNTWNRAERRYALVRAANHLYRYLWLLRRAHRTWVKLHNPTAYIPSCGYEAAEAPAADKVPLGATLCSAFIGSPLLPGAGGIHRLHYWWSGILLTASLVCLQHVQPSRPVCTVIMASMHSRQWCCGHSCYQITAIKSHRWRLSGRSPYWTAGLPCIAPLHS